MNPIRHSRSAPSSFGVVSGVLTVLATTPLLADEVLQEVVVSAQKREQNIQDVGIAINAFTGDQLSKLGVRESVDVAQFTPGVFTSGAIAGQNTQFSIRGVTQNDFNDIVESPNAVYLDDGYIAVGQAQTFALFDIDRVEVLKGPQGTLFGRNATGGLVQYISRKPSFDELQAYADLTYGYFDSPAHAQSQQVEAAIGAPLADHVAARLAVLYKSNESYLKNLYPLGAPTSGLGTLGSAPGAGANMGSDETYALRYTLDYLPHDDLLLRVSANYAHSRLSTGPYQSKSTIGVVDPATGELVNVINTPLNESRLSIKGSADGGGNAIDGSSLSPGAMIGLPGRPVPGGDFFGYLDKDGAAWTTSSDFAFKRQNGVRTWGVNGRAEWNFGNKTTLTSVTDYKNYWKLVFVDVDSAPINQLANYAGVSAHSVTEELRLNGELTNARWVTGLYLLDIGNESNNGLKAPANSIIAQAIEPVDIGVISKLKTRSYSLFAQGEYDFTDHITGILGARAIEEKKDFNTAIGFLQSFSSFTVNQGAFIPNFLNTGEPYFYGDKSSRTLWAGKAQLNWHPYEGLLVYGGVNRGVKAGSYNAPLLGAYLGSGGNSSIPYHPETLIAYEAGFKSTLAGGRLRLNGSAYHYNYKDYQAFLFVGVGGVVINRDAYNDGGELELQWRPAKGLDVLLSGAYMNAVVKNVPLRFGSPLPPRDVQPTYAPKTQAAAMVRYEWPMLGGMMNVRTNASYSDKFYYNLRNFSADAFPAYTLINAGLGWATENDAVQINFDVRNLSNTHAGLQGYDLATLCGCNEVAYHPPRWFGLNVRVNY